MDHFVRRTLLVLFSYGSHTRVVASGTAAIDAVDGGGGANSRQRRSTASMLTKSLLTQTVELLLACSLILAYLHRLPPALISVQPQPVERIFFTSARMSSLLCRRRRFVVSDRPVPLRGATIASARIRPLGHDLQAAIAALVAAERAELLQQTTVS